MKELARLTYNAKEKGGPHGLNLYVLVTYIKTRLILVQSEIRTALKKFSVVQSNQRTESVTVSAPLHKH